MADSKVSDLTAASTLDGTELYYIVQGGADRKATGAQIGPLTVRVTVSSADILALFTTPKTIIAAPGAGFAIQVLDYVNEFKFNTIAYTQTSDVVIDYAGGVSSLHSIDAGRIFDFIAATQSKFGVGVMSQDTGTSPFVLNRTRVENKAVQMYCLTANPTLGDGVLYVTIRYQIYAFQG